MQIHQVTPDEWRLWRDVRLEALAADPAEFGATLASEQEYGEDEWRERVARSLSLVALDPGPVGLVGAISKHGDLYLFSMWVRSSHRGRGVGEALVKAVLARAAEEGCKRVRLRVWEQNLPARKLYERLGFVDSDEPEHMEYEVR